MDFEQVTFVGPGVDDPRILDDVPDDLRQLLQGANGLIAWAGGLHIRGACVEPAWHSLRNAWIGELAFHEHYLAVQRTDVPFAEDAVGDQWLLRSGTVVQLRCEDGSVTEVAPSLGAFLSAAARDPVETLGLHPLLQHQEDGGSLAPGRLLSVYPPFCTKEAENGVAIGGVPAGERLGFLMDLASQLAAIEDGHAFRIRFDD